MKKITFRMGLFITTVFFFLLSISLVMAGTITYTYDGAGRLIKADYGGGTAIEYTYDDAGNLLQRKVTVQAPPVGNTLTLTKVGTGSGTVKSTPAGIDCGSDCSETYTQATKITLKATVDAGSTFKGWSGDCTGTKTTCKLVMDSAKAVTATFALPDLRGEWSTITVTEKNGIYTISGTLTAHSDEAKATKVKAKAYLSDDDQYDAGDTELGLTTVGTINGGALKAKKVKFKAASNPSGKYLIAVIDPDNTVPEANENNNTAVSQLP